MFCNKVDLLFVSFSFQYCRKSLLSDQLILNSAHVYMTYNTGYAMLTITLKTVEFFHSSQFVVILQSVDKSSENDGIQFKCIFLGMLTHVYKCKTQTHSQFFSTATA